MPPPKASAPPDPRPVILPCSSVKAGIGRIVIAQWGRTYAEALQLICAGVFPTAKIVICGNGAETLSTLRQEPADLLLLALSSFPDMDGVDLLPPIAAEKLAARLLVASQRREEHSLQALRTARFDGLIDTLEESVETLSRALQLVAMGEAYISPTFRTHVIEKNPPGVLAQKLTPAEIHVLAEIGDGSGNREAAVKMGLSEATVQTHRRNIMRKLGISSSAKLVREAVRLGMVRITTEGTVIRPGFDKIASSMLPAIALAGLTSLPALPNIG